MSAHYCDCPHCGRSHPCSNQIDAAEKQRLIEHAVRIDIERIGKPYDVVKLLERDFARSLGYDCAETLERWRRESDVFDACTVQIGVRWWWIVSAYAKIIANGNNGEQTPASGSRLRSPRS